jgi:hypothetical protein
VRRSEYDEDAGKILDELFEPEKKRKPVSREQRQLNRALGVA